MWQTGGAQAGGDGGRSDDDLDISSFLSDFLQDAEEDIGVETSFVGFVHNNGAVHLQFVVVETLTQ